MADIQDRTANKTLKAFRVRKVLTLEELATLLQSSLSTARRRLKVWNTLTSYNKNGRYYVLPSVAAFDASGLWRYRDIGFSRYGNLTETLIALVGHSPAGLSAAELGRLLGMEPRSFLWLFRNHPALTREKHHGRFVYFAAESVLHRRQRAGRMILDAHAKLIEDFRSRVECPSASDSSGELIPTISAYGLVLWALDAATVTTPLCPRASCHRGPNPTGFCGHRRGSVDARHHPLLGRELAIGSPVG